MDGTHQNVRIITVLGAFFTSLGLFLARFNTKPWHLYTTQSILYGVGSSMYYFPIMSLTPVYFDAHRGFAMGLILSGSGAGGLAFAPVVNSLITKYGIRWALRTLGIWNLVVRIPVACIIRKRQGFGCGDTRVAFGLAKRGTFLYQSAGAFLQTAGNFVPMYYMTTYSTSVLGYSASTASLVLALNNAVNSISRVSMGVLAARIGRQNTTIASVMLSALSAYAGGYSVLLPTTITDVFGVRNYAAVNGAIYFIRGIGTLFGAPVVGVILGVHACVFDGSEKDVQRGGVV
ncbi:MFS general substrate transporter [Paxillus ammoniavirescens]|nr:MFS general substrate transporter [Paxillus ammoniavirescens]